jgi:hypothetical protein
MNCNLESELSFVDPIRFALLLVPLTEGFQIQRQWRAHPRRSLSMITDLIVGVGMYQSAERTSIYHQPADECSELRWGEDIDLKLNGRRVSNCLRHLDTLIPIALTYLEHGDWMRTNWSIEDLVDT